MQCTENNVDVDLQNEVIFLKNKLVVDIVRDVAGGMERPLREKLRKILADVDMSYYLNLHNDTGRSDHRTVNIFGLSPPLLEELTFSEQKLLQTEVEKYILDKFPKQFDLYDELLAGAVNEEPKGNVSEEQAKLLYLSNLYVDKLDESAKQLAKMCEMMTACIDKRLKDTVNRSMVTTEYYHVKNKLVELKAKIIQVQLSLTVYSHHGSSLAYMEINKDITKSIDNLRVEIMSYKRILGDD